MNENEQWKDGAGGKCELCRRHGYCKKQCKENRRMVYRLMMDGIKKGLAERKNKMSEDGGTSPDETAQEE